MRKGELVVFNVAFFYDCTKICPFYLSAVWLVGFVPMNIWVRSSLIRPPSIKGDRVMISLCPAWCLCWETTTEVLQTSLEAAPRPHLRHFVKFISEIDLQVAKSDAALYHVIAQDYKGLLYWKAAFFSTTLLWFTGNLPFFYQLVNGCAHVTFQSKCWHPNWVLSLQVNEMSLHQRFQRALAFVCVRTSLMPVGWRSAPLQWNENRSRAPVQQINYLKHISIEQNI